MTAWSQWLPGLADDADQQDQPPNDSPVNRALALLGQGAQHAGSALDQGVSGVGQGLSTASSAISQGASDLGQGASDVLQSARGGLTSVYDTLHDPASTEALTSSIAAPHLTSRATLPVANAIRSMTGAPQIAPEDAYPGPQPMLPGGGTMAASVANPVRAFLGAGPVPEAEVQTANRFLPAVSRQGEELESGIRDTLSGLRAGAGELATGVQQRDVVGAGLGALNVGANLDPRTVAANMLNHLLPTVDIGGHQVGAGDAVMAAAGGAGLIHLGRAALSGGVKLLNASPGVLRSLGDALDALEQGGGQAERGLANAVPDEAGATGRFYHGTASDFERANADKFDKNGLYGPGYYLTSDPRVASSYAESRAPASGQTGQVQWLQGQIDSAKGLLADPSTPVADHAGLQESIRWLDEQIGNLGPRGANVRPLDVPHDLNLLDVDRPLRAVPTFLGSLEQSLGDPRIVNRFRDAMRDQAARATGPSTVDDAWRALETTYRDIYHTDTPYPYLHKDLADAGYDGISMTGGRRVPLKDEAGRPLEHDVRIIFPESLGKVRQAYSGDYGGALPSPALPNALGPALAAARGVAPTRGLVGAGLGGVSGAATGYETAPEDASPADVATRTVAGGLLGSAVGGTIGSAGTLAAGSLIDSLVARGALDARILATHPEFPDRIRALFSLAAEGLPDDAVVPVPAMASALARLRPKAAEAVSDLLGGPVTAGQVRDAVGAADSPGVVQTVQSMVVDALTGLGARARRGRETAADAATVRGISEEARQLTTGQVGSAVPTRDTQHGQAQLATPESAPNLTSFVGDIADKLGIPRPGVYIAPSTALNASATTVGEAPALVLTQGLLKAGLSDAEMEAVLTHELAHTAQDSRGPLGRAFGAVRDAVGNVMGQGTQGARDVAAALPEERALGFQGEQARLREQAAQETEQPSAAQPRLIPNDPLGGRTVTTAQGPTAQGPTAQGPTQQLALPGVPPSGPNFWEWLKKISYTGLIGPTSAFSQGVGGLTQTALGAEKAITRAIAEGRPGSAPRIVGAAARAVPDGFRSLFDVLSGGQGPQGVAQGWGGGGPSMASRVNNPLGRFAAHVLDYSTTLWAQSPDAFFAPIFRAMGEREAAEQAAQRTGVSADQLMADAAAARTAGTRAATSAVQDVMDAGQQTANALGFKGDPGKFGNALARLSKENTARGFLASFLLPFPSMTVKSLKATGRLVPGVGEVIGRAEGADRFSRLHDQMLGPIALAAMGYYASEGGITGSGPASASARDELVARGWQPHSVLIGGYYMPTRYFQHLAPFLDAVGEFHDSYAYGKPLQEDRGSILGDFASRLGKVATNQTGLDQINSLLTALGGGDSGSQTAALAARSVGRYIPFGATLRTAASLTDPSARKPVGRSPDEYLPGRSFAQNLEQSIPGLRQLVPERADVLGRAMPNVQRGLAPAMGDDPLLSTYQRAGLGVGGAPSSVTDPITGEDRRLTDAERARFEQAYGRALRQQWEGSGQTSDARRLGQIRVRAHQQALAEALGR